MGGQKYKIDLVKIENISDKLYKQDVLLNFFKCGTGASLCIVFITKLSSETDNLHNSD